MSTALFKRGNTMSTDGRMLTQLRHRPEGAGSSVITSLNTWPGTLSVIVLLTILCTLTPFRASTVFAADLSMTSPTTMRAERQVHPESASTSPGVETVEGFHVIRNSKRRANRQSRRRSLPCQGALLARHTEPPAGTRHVARGQPSW